MARPTRRSPRTVAAALTVPFAALLALSSCAERITSVTPENSPMPEGVRANSDLIVYMDTPIRVVDWFDKGTPGISPDDSLISDVLLYDVAPGVLIGTIIDSSDASAYDVFRRFPTGGYAPLQDVRVHPAKSWLQGQYELYRFSDRAPLAAGTYVGRGVVNGLITPNAPLTNVATLLQASVDGSLKYLGNVATGFPDSTDDSLFNMRWEAVPGAAGYWITVSGATPASLTGEELYRSALPRPLLPERIPEYYVVYVPAPLTSYKLVGQGQLDAGDPVGPPGTRLLHHRLTLTDVQYFVRIAAVDPNGQLLSYTRDDAKAAVAFQRTDVGYTIFPLGFVIVKPTRKPPPTALSGSALAPLADLEVGEVRVLTRGELPAALRP